MNKKIRRHSGYRSPNATISRKDIIKNDFFINDIYDDWYDYRDGQRDWYSDFKKIKTFTPRWANCEYSAKRKRMNLKQKYLLKRRERMKNNPRKS